MPGCNNDACVYKFHNIPLVCSREGIFNYREFKEDMEKVRSCEDLLDVAKVGWEAFRSLMFLHYRVG